MTQEEVVGQVVEALDRAGLVYMLVGSLASNHHGRPRMTQDADLVIDGSEVQVAALARALGAAFYVDEDTAREAARRRDQFNAIHLATGFKIDLILRKPRPFSVGELERRVAGSLAGRPLSIASAEDTVLVKLEWARRGDSARQFADAAGVIEVQGERLDRAYLRRWAVELGVADLLERAERGLPFEG